MAHDFVIECNHCGIREEGNGNLREMLRAVKLHDQECGQLNRWEARNLRRMRRDKPANPVRLVGKRPLDVE